MKITRYFIAAASLLTMLTACNSDLEKVTYHPANATKGQLAASQTDIRLTAASTKQDVMTLTWGKSDFGSNAGVVAAVKYTVQMDTRGGDFTNAYTLAATGDTTITFTGKDLNAAVLALQKLKNPDAEASYDEQAVDVRVSSTFSEDVTPLLSNTLAMNITPYAGKLEFAKMAVPGSHQGWDPTNYNQALYATDTSKPKVYEGYIYFPAGSEFKFALGSWDENWGCSDITVGTLEAGGANIKPEEGMYYIEAKPDELTATFTQTHWSLIGSAIDDDWSVDIDMTWNADKKVYEATTELKEGEFKFRANHDWAINFGGADGTLVKDGPNIWVEGGTYYITLDLQTTKSHLEPTFTCTKQ